MRSLPDVGLLPDQSPDASQVTASVVDHVSIVEPSKGTDDASDANVTVGGVGAGVGEVTDTVTDALTLAFWSFSQVSVYVVSASSGPVDTCPDNDFGPVHPPLASQRLAFCELQTSIDSP